MTSIFCADELRHHLDPAAAPPIIDAQRASLPLCSLPTRRAQNVATCLKTGLFAAMGMLIRKNPNRVEDVPHPPTSMELVYIQTVYPILNSFFPPAHVGAISRSPFARGMTCFRALPRSNLLSEQLAITIETNLRNMLCGAIDRALEKVSTSLWAAMGPRPPDMPLAIYANAKVVLKLLFQPKAIWTSIPGNGPHPYLQLDVVNPLLWGEAPPSPAVIAFRQRTISAFSALYRLAAYILTADGVEGRLLPLDQNFPAHPAIADVRKAVAKMPWSDILRPAKRHEARGRAIVFNEYAATLHFELNVIAFLENDRVRMREGFSPIRYLPEKNNASIDTFTCTYTMLVCHVYLPLNAPQSQRSVARFEKRWHNSHGQGPLPSRARRIPTLFRRDGRTPIDGKEVDFAERAHVFAHLLNFDKIRQLRRFYDAQSHHSSLERGPPNERHQLPIEGLVIQYAHKGNAKFTIQYSQVPIVDCPGDDANERARNHKLINQSRSLSANWDRHAKSNPY